MQEKLKIVHVGCRMSEGGAARVAIDIIKNDATENEHDFIYGYSRRGRRSKLESVAAHSAKIGGIFRASLNLALFRLLNRDVVAPNSRVLTEAESLLKRADIIHIHGLHSYFFPLEAFVEIAEKTSAKIVVTTHDFWWLTGRCAFTEGCENWKCGCGHCPKLSNYPPVYVDFSRSNFERKQAEIGKIRGRITFSSPATFLAEQHRLLYPASDIVVIRNAASAEFVSVSKNFDRRPLYQNAPFKRVAVVTADFSDETKVSPDSISKLSCLSDLEIRLIGKNSDRYKKNGVKSMGEISNRQGLAEALANSHYLVFTSTKDICPLVVIEALVLGVIPLCIDSPATRELMDIVHLQCFSQLSEIIEYLAPHSSFSWPKELEKSLTVRRLAVSEFSPDLLARRYGALYRKIACKEASATG